MNRYYARSDVRYSIPWGMMLAAIVIGAAFFVPYRTLAARETGDTVKVAVLIYGENRQETLAGFQAEMTAHDKEWHHNIVYEIKNAQGDRTRLPGLAMDIIASKPDVAVAGGGVEADALKEAASGTGVPVVFLAVTAAVDRGLAREMQLPGGNLTGIETSDALLNGKRLWYIKKILPEAERITVLHVPSIGASVESLKAAKQAAAELGLELTVLEGENGEDLVRAAGSITRENTDAVLLFPVAIIDKIQEEALLPLSLEKKIPVMGYYSGSLKRGAFASYAGSRYEMGRQAVHLVHKIVMGEDPAVIPIETPEKIELIINRWMVNRLGVQLPDRAWRMADGIVQISF